MPGPDMSIAEEGDKKDKKYFLYLVVFILDMSVKVIYMVIKYGFIFLLRLLKTLRSLDSLKGGEQ
jgi:hypothetical protein